MNGLPTNKSEQTELGFHRLVEGIVDAAMVDTTDHVASLEARVKLLENALQAILGGVQTAPRRASQAPLLSAIQPQATAAGVESETDAREARRMKLNALLAAEIAKSRDGEIAVTAGALAKLANDEELNGDCIAAFLAFMRKNGHPTFRVSIGAVSRGRRATWVIKQARR